MFYSNAQDHHRKLAQTGSNGHWLITYM